MAVMDEIERRAKLICGAMHAANPKTPLFAAPNTPPMEIWRLYIEPARIMIADEERRAEEAKTVHFGKGEKVEALFDREIEGYGRVMLRHWPGEIWFWVDGQVVGKGYPRGR